MGSQQDISRSRPDLLSFSRFCKRENTLATPVSPQAALHNATPQTARGRASTSREGLCRASLVVMQSIPWAAQCCSRAIHARWAARCFSHICTHLARRNLGGTGCSGSLAMQGWRPMILALVANNWSPDSRPRAAGRIFILGTIRRLSARGQHAKKQGARA